MSKQREILPVVLNLIRGHFPGSPVALSGSVCSGDERCDSDIDLLVIVPDASKASFPEGKVEWEEADFKLVRAFFDDIPLHLHFGTTALLAMFEQKPWRAYKFLQIEVLYDPDGTIQAYKDRIAPWFSNHPDIVALWKEWLDQWKDRNVSRGKRQGDLITKYPDVGQWWPYLDGIVRNKNTNESES